MGTRTKGTRLIVAIGLCLVGPLMWSGLAEAATAVPYTDPNAVGYIGLCNQAGQQITSGSINTTPFAWRAVSTQPAQAPYNNAGRTATLYGYQPQQGLLPGEWSGEQLTSSARYSNPANPMAAATDGDDSLEDLIQDYPPRWDGFFQLRIYLSTADEQAYDLHYPALNIQVTGDTWQAVGGGAVNCKSGTSESLETIVLPKSKITSPGASSSGGSKGTTAGAKSTTATSAPTASSSSSGSSSGSSIGATGHSSAVEQPASATSHTLLVVVLVAIVVVVLALGFLLLRRRRLASTDPGGLHSSSKKGPNS
jgi:hypothetical protein